MNTDSITKRNIESMTTVAGGKGDNYKLTGYLWRFKGYDNWNYTTTNPAAIGGMMEYKELYERS